MSGRQSQHTKGLGRAAKVVGQKTEKYRKQHERTDDYWPHHPYSVVRRSRRIDHEGRAQRTERYEADETEKGDYAAFEVDLAGC